MAGSPSVDIGVKTAATLAAVEIGLGSVLHGLRVPFSGFMLSLNQGFFLARATFVSAHDPSAKTLPSTISSLVALLKSLSPAGKRLTPMLGITVQGLLFNFGTLTLGRGVVGALVGAVLLALWGFVQPLVIYYALFGERMLDVGKELAKDAAKILPLEPRHFIIAAVTLVALKALLAMVVTLVARAASPEAVRRYEDRLVKAGAARRGRMLASLDENEDKARAGVPLIAARAAARGALTDLASPLYLVSLALGAAFLVFVESDFVGAIWMAARFFAVGFLVFFALRVLPVERLTLRLEAARSPSVAAFARRLRATLGLLKEM